MSDVELSEHAAAERTPKRPIRASVARLLVPVWIAAVTGVGLTIVESAVVGFLFGRPWAAVATAAIALVIVATGISAAFRFAERKPHIQAAIWLTTAAVAMFGVLFVWRGQVPIVV